MTTFVSTRITEAKVLETESPLHVAVAAIVNGRHEVLISRRPGHVHQGGMWEFPGGKLEPGETVLEALDRELREELGVTAIESRPLIRIRHKYPELYVDLDVWRIEGLQGVPSGHEGQQVEWAAVKTLHERSFPAADRAIIRALQLPSLYLITPEPDNTDGDFLVALEKALNSGVRLVQLRAKQQSTRKYYDLARDVLACCRAHGARLLLNSRPQIVLDVGADGVHLSADRLLGLTTRPLDPSLWVAASCHNREELEHALRIGVDFVLVSPVHRTVSHPDAQPLEWAGFSVLCDLATVPVYALGGLTLTELDRAYRHGAQGIAAMRALWPEKVKVSA